MTNEDYFIYSQCDNHHYAEEFLIGQGDNVPRFDEVLERMEFSTWEEAEQFLEEYRKNLDYMESEENG